MEMDCGEKATLVEEPSLCPFEGRRCNGIGQSFGTKSIAEATSLIREELRRTYAAQMERRMHEHKLKEPHGVESNDKKKSTSDILYIKAKTESNEEEMFNTEVYNNPSFLQQCLVGGGTESEIIKSTFKPEASLISEKEVDLDMACEPVNILNSEEQILSNGVFAVGHCPTKRTSISPPLDCSLYDTPVRVTGIFQNTSVSKRQTNSCIGDENNQVSADIYDHSLFSASDPEMSFTGDENNQVSADVYDQRLFSASDPEMSFIPASEEIKEKRSQPNKKALKETVIKEIVNGSMENIADISKEDVLSPELILSLPSRQAFYQSSFSTQETLPQYYSCRKKLSYTIRKKKFSDLSNFRKKHSNTKRKKRFSSYRKLSCLSSGLEESSEENSMSSSDESSSDLDWCETLRYQHHISRCSTSSKTRRKCGITLEKESVSSPSFLVNEETHTSCQGNKMHVPGIDFYLDALSNAMYQPCVFVVDCCKVKRSLKEMLECRICLRGLQCSGFVSVTSIS